MHGKRLRYNFRSGEIALFLTLYTKPKVGVMYPAPARRSKIFLEEMVLSTSKPSGDARKYTGWEGGGEGLTDDRESSYFVK